ncbi:MAG: serine protease [Flavobacteriia bacterium]|nr:MAG: serine protease [Flavobacteriia bacterium]
MIKSYVYLLLGVMMWVFYACESDQQDLQNLNQQPQSVSQEEPLTATKVSEEINLIIQKNGSFDWKDASDYLLWSAAMNSDNIISVGYGETSFSEEKSKVLLESKENLMKRIAANEGVTVADVLLHDDAILNYFDIKVSKKSTIQLIRSIPDVRYVQPTGFSQSYFERSDSGCSNGPEVIAAADFTTLNTGAKVPWSYTAHNIDQAWDYSTGQGVTVAVIDTGVSDYQVLLGDEFNDFYPNRTIQKYGTFIDSWWFWATETDGYHDKCGHGTSASATIGAPNNTRGGVIGIAYESNIVSYRGTEDVVLNDYHEKKGVSQALTELADRSDVRIISMSIGYMWSIGNIKDAIQYAYSKGKLMFAAGGTSTDFTNWYGVIFPASMSETVAVTGVKEEAVYNECDVCHVGSAIDFTYVMERANSNHQPVLGYETGENRYFGGSSVATASVAGIAALVWSEYPTWNRSDVLQRLKEASDLYPGKDSEFGYGNVDALKAVRGY